MNFILDTILMSYARVFFSSNRLLGGFILASTFIIPVHGVFGLAGGVFSSLFARLFGMNREAVQGGIYGFNGILTGLALGYFFEPTATMIALLLCASIIVTFVTIFLNDAFSRLLGLPAMSMPLNLVAWLLLVASAGLGYLSPSAERCQLVALPSGLLPDQANWFFSALGSVLFQVNPVAGIIICVGLIIWSRIALLLMLAGFVASFWMQDFLGIDPTSLGGYSLAFNHMFAAFAIGGIFTVPGPASLMLAVIASLVSTIILAGTLQVFPHNISPLALPFNLAVMLILYSLRLRALPTLGLKLAPDPPGAPEENLSKQRENNRVWRRWGVPLALPFHGVWKVSQAVGGALTHQGDWRFAYDFMATGPDNRPYRGEGGRREDYYSFGLPVFAPAGGKVASVVDTIADNEIGTINAADNWGNHVIIEHAEGWYSCIAHLKQGSVRVKAGDAVLRHAQLALCGNSGRSPYPHLHMQMQASRFAGSATVPFEFQNILIAQGSKESFVSKGGVQEGDRVRNAVPIPDASSFFPSAVGTAFSLRYSRAAKVENELWRVKVDFYGNTYLESSPKTTRLYFLMAGGLLSIKKLEGSRDTGLFLFGSVVSEVPFLEAGTDVPWETIESADYVLHPLAVKLLDLFSMIGLSVKQKLEAKAQFRDDELLVSTAPCLVLETPLGAVALKRLPRAELRFVREKGLTGLKAGDAEITGIE